MLSLTKVLLAADEYEEARRELWNVLRKDTRTTSRNLWLYIRSIRFSKKIATAEISITKNTLIFNPVFFYENIETYDDLLFLILHERSHIFFRKVLKWDIVNMVSHKLQESLSERDVNFLEDSVINAMVKRLNSASTLAERFYHTPESSPVFSFLTSKLHPEFEDIEHLGLRIAHRRLYEDPNDEWVVRDWLNQAGRYYLQWKKEKAEENKKAQQEVREAEVIEQGKQLGPQNSEESPVILSATNSEQEGEEAKPVKAPPVENTPLQEMEVGEGADEENQESSGEDQGDEAGLTKAKQDSDEDSDDEGYYDDKGYYDDDGDEAGDEAGGEDDFGTSPNCLPDALAQIDVLKNIFKEIVECQLSSVGRNAGTGGDDKLEEYPLWDNSPEVDIVNKISRIFGDFNSIDIELHSSRISVLDILATEFKNEFSMYGVDKFVDVSQATMPGSLSRRDAFTLGSGYIPTLWRAKYQPVSAPKYDIWLDVSGSMSSFLGILPVILRNLKDMAGEVWNFSTENHKLPMAQALQYYKSTGGTSFNEAFRQIILNGNPYVVFVSDGCSNLNFELKEKFLKMKKRLIYIHTEMNLGASPITDIADKIIDLSDRDLAARVW